MNKKEYLPVLAGIVVAVVFGFSFMFTKEALGVVAPFHLLGLRFMVATTVLTILKLLGLIKINFKGKRLQVLLVLSLFQPVSYFIFETLGVKMTSSSQAGMMIALIPVVVAILGTIFLKEKPGKIQSVFIGLSVVGVVFIAIMTGNVDIGSSLAGIFVLLGAVISAGVFNILSRQSSLRFTPVEITFVMMWVGVVTFNTIAITQHLITGEITQYFSPLADPTVLTAILYLGILSSVIAFFMVNFMLSKIEASKSAVFSNLTTVVSIVAGVFIRNEPFYWFHVIGGMMILAGVWGTNYYGHKRASALIKEKYETLQS
ncbi:protein of unknown function DUF6, transmembrane [Alkaliphilus metalliredigens QYMF]|uniref:EamA domain-containing protein n=1 Tax=Alkaliphilus metalliredigens (strain QYMF) TaxID=293826 RepID=A6TUE6_ALKMQ|nr:DMT family transporter [Alkaliphilus metalliredigens]ABR49814.1 protein of unknown function DUF6, transmembrane [Alkaliphilus metalliredigens QYMF]